MARVKPPGPEPKEKMPSHKFWASMAIAAGLDLLKFCCDMLVFVAPILVGTIVGIEFGKLAGIAAGALSGAAILPVAPAIEMFGIISAELVALVGWCFFFFWFLFSEINMFGGRSVSRFIAVASGEIASFIPLLDLVPTFTPTVWYICHHERKEYRRARQKWERENAAWLRQEAADREAYTQQVQAAQMQEEEETQESEEATAEAELEAANDNEIPEKVAQTA